MEYSQFPLIPFFIIGVSFAVPIISSRFRSVFIPVIAGEILAGIAVVQSGLGLFRKSVVMALIFSATWLGVVVPALRLGRFHAHRRKAQRVKEHFTAPIDV